MESRALSEQRIINVKFLIPKSQMKKMAGRIMPTEKKNL
jgi:hypothetical protein